MSEPRTPPGRHLRPEGLVAGLGILSLVTWSIYMLMRLPYALELEWMEGGHLLQAMAIASGGQAYPEPSLDFVPFLYTPLYSVLLALFGKLLGFSLVVGRCVSLAACAMAGVAMWRILREEGARASHAWIALGLWAGSYTFCYRWLDLVRADALFLALCAWAWLWLRRASMEEASGRRYAGLIVGASLCFSLAFWTKQTAAPFIVAAGFWTLLGDRRSTGWLVLGVGAGCLGPLAWGQWRSEGWLWTYIYELHQSHAFNAARFYQKSWGMLAHAGTFALVGAGWALARPGAWSSTRRPQLKARAFWGLTLVAALLAGALGYSTQWAEANAFVPVGYFGALNLGLWLSQREGRPGGRGLLVCLGLQLCFGLGVEPRYQVLWDRGPSALGESYLLWPWARGRPSSREAIKARELRDTLADGGALLAWHRPWWAVLADGDGHAGAMNWHDIPASYRAEISREVRTGLREGRWEQVWLEGVTPAFMRFELERNYELVETRSGAERIRPMSGWMSRAGMQGEWKGRQRRFQRRADAAR